MALNLAYLAAIWFMPFPTALVGRYTDDPISVVMHAVTLGVASALEAVTMLVAHRGQLFSQALPRPMRRHVLGSALLPGLLFFVSIPVAFAFAFAFVTTSWTQLSWQLIYPLECAWARMFKPAGATEFLA